LIKTWPLLKDVGRLLGTRLRVLLSVPEYKFCMMMGQQNCQHNRLSTHKQQKPQCPAEVTLTAAWRLPVAIAISVTVLLLGVVHVESHEPMMPTDECCLHSL
jgi:hypothetical protein